MKFNKLQKNKGFTLIELMIATTLFTIIMLMGVGSLVVSSNSAKSSQKLRIAVDNVNFAMESMTRELRMGTIYTCPAIDFDGFSTVQLSNLLAARDCADGGNLIAFMPQQVGVNPPIRVAYKLNGRTDGTKTLQRCEADVTPCSDIVSKDVDVKTLKFYVVGADSSTTNVQPSVRILMTGSVNIKGNTTDFSLETIASQRSAEY